MAAKLRADAARLEAEKAQQLADAAEKAFRKFDTNQDGEITLEELKAGLEKALKMDLSEKRVKELMREFDESGDGRLQLDEFVGVDQFRNKLEALSREEKRLAAEAKKMAQKEAEVAKLLQTKMEILNDREPTAGDKVLSILPYLFPLMDGLQYGRFLLGAEGAESNPFVIAVAILYALYRTIPFSGFIAFFVVSSECSRNILNVCGFGRLESFFPMYLLTTTFPFLRHEQLNFLQGNPGLNRLIRYNMQQAIFIDIALFFPGLLSGLIGLILGGANVQLPTVVTQISTDAIFVTLLAVLGYCTVSSLLGIEPNKVPIISQAVNDRMPTVDMFEIDDKGNIFANPNRRRKEEEEKKKDNQDKEKDEDKSNKND